MPLSARNRLELALLCEEYVERSDQPGATDAGIALLVGYVLAEGLTEANFSERDRAELPNAYQAAVLGPAGVAAGIYSAPPPGASGTEVVTLAGRIFGRMKEYRTGA